MIVHAHRPTHPHIWSHATRWILWTHGKNNKPHEGVWWSHKSDFSYVQACYSAYYTLFSSGNYDNSFRTFNGDCNEHVVCTTRYLIVWQHRKSFFLHCYTKTCSGFFEWIFLIYRILPFCWLIQIIFSNASFFQTNLKFLLKGHCFCCFTVL